MKAHFVVGSPVLEQVLARTRDTAFSAPNVHNWNEASTLGPGRGRESQPD